jgi:hypothetical protein
VAGTEILQEAYRNLYDETWLRKPTETMDDILSVGILKFSNIVSRAKRLRVVRPGFDSWPEQDIHLYSAASRQVLGPIQTPIQ